MREVIEEYGRAYLYSDGSGVSGLALTLWLLVMSCLAGALLAVPMALARVSRRKWLSRGVGACTYVLRGTPLYIQLLMVYTGLYSLAFVRENPVLAAVFKDAMWCALIAFGLNTAAYTTELLAGSLRETPHGEIEAARAIGLPPRRIVLDILLPSALRRAIPAYGNEVIFLLHATSVAFSVTLKDLMAVARLANAQTFRPLESFGLAALLYLMTTMLLVWLFRRLERRWLAPLQPSARLNQAHV